MTEQNDSALLSEASFPEPKQGLGDFSFVQTDKPI